MPSKVTSSGLEPNEMDCVLNLEEQYYDEGYNEGLAAKAFENYLEGKQYGLQVGLQRFLLVGEIEGSLDVIDSWQIENKGLARHIETVRCLLSGLKLDNNEDTVLDFESRFMKIKNKFRTILLLVNRHFKNTVGGSLTLDLLEEMSQNVAGELRAYVENDNDAEDDTMINDKRQDW